MKDNSLLFYDFLTSHSFKVLQFLKKAGGSVNEMKLEWKALTQAKSKDLALAINVWATIQEKYMVS
jgi:dethiobiotin synthetase